MFKLKEWEKEEWEKEEWKKWFITEDKLPGPVLLAIPALLSIISIIISMIIILR